MLELLYACGMRTTELCRLKVVDVDLQEQTAFIEKGKGNISRSVPIGQYAAHYIGEYVAKARRYFLKGKRSDPGQALREGLLERAGVQHYRYRWICDQFG